jgi:probable HAF family extracellular repeat protein
MTDLNTSGGALGGFSEAHGINDVGQVVGRAFLGGYQRAFITGPDGTEPRFLMPFEHSQANGINDAGEVVGFSYGGCCIYAFTTDPDGMVMRNLGAPGEAQGINDAGQVVGWAYSGVGLNHYAFITGPNGTGLTDLNSLVDLPQGVVLIGATGINNVGQVITTLIPEPESYALLLAGLALIGVMIVWRKKDIGPLAA